MRSLTLVTVVLLFILTAPLLAQDNVLDLRLIEFNKDGKVTYANFIYVRNFGRLMFELFHLRIPQADDYRETTLGAGYNVLTIGDVAIYGLGHLSTASDEDYFEPALFAIDVEGKLTGSLFLLHYVPLGSNGIYQWLIDPIEVQYSVWRSVSIGGSGYFWRPEGGPWLRKIGPKVSLADKFGTSELRISSVSDGGVTEIQLRRIFLF